MALHNAQKLRDTLIGPVVIGLILSGCGSEIAAMQDKTDCEASFPIVSSSGEPTFVQKYSANFPLPVPRENFVDFLVSKKLRYDILGPTLIPHPRHCPGFSMANITSAIVIYGDDAGKRVENFLALEDRSGKIVYVESRFSYSPSF